MQQDPHDLYRLALTKGCGQKVGMLPKKIARAYSPSLLIPPSSTPGSATDSHTLRRMSLGGAPACCLGTLANFPQSWTYSCKLQTRAPSCLTRGEQLTSSLTKRSSWIKSCGRPDRTPSRCCFVTSCYV